MLLRYTVITIFVVSIFVRVITPEDDFTESSCLKLFERCDATSTDSESVCCTGTVCRRLRGASDDDIEICLHPRHRGVHRHKGKHYYTKTTVKDCIQHGEACDSSVRNTCCVGDVCDESGVCITSHEIYAPRIRHYKHG